VPRVANRLTELKSTRGNPLNVLDDVVDALSGEEALPLIGGTELRLDGPADLEPLGCSSER
jgi:hypothetical protein